VEAAELEELDKTVTLETDLMVDQEGRLPSLDQPTSLQEEVEVVVTSQT
jgi:hypothetical protein